MKIKLFLNSIFFVLITGLMFVTSEGIIIGKEDNTSQKQKKMYIKNLSGEGVKKQLLERIRGKILSTIMDISGSEYNILDDETVIVMYDQAKKIMASGCDDDSCVSQIAEGINADVIIHGEVSVEGANITISIKRIDRNKKTLEMGIISRVSQTFKESQVDWFAEESAKQLMNPKYKIDPSKAPGIFDSTIDIKTIKLEGSENFNVKVLQFETDDDTLQSLIEIAKKYIKDGDALFAEKEYESAIKNYRLVVERIDNKLTDENKQKIKSFREETVMRADTAYAMMYKLEMENIDGELKSEKDANESFLNKIIGNYNNLLKKMKKDVPQGFFGENTSKLENAINSRIDSCYVAICGLHEKLGDNYCGDYRFDKGYDEYNLALAVANNIKGELKIEIEQRYYAKLDATQKTGENYLIFKVKSFADRAQIYNFEDKTSDAKSMLKDARAYMTGGMMKFITTSTIDKYNVMAKVLNVGQINKDSEPKIFEQIRVNAKLEVEAKKRRLVVEEQKRCNATITELKRKGEYKTGKVKKFGNMDFVLITGGEFTMGSPQNEKGRNSNEKQHKVTLSTFYMGKYEVTQKQYKEIMGKLPWYFKGDNFPVEYVSWYDAVEFCNEMSEKNGLKPYYNIQKDGKDPNNTNNSDNLKWTVTIAGGNGFRLPTETEWEYACKAGTTTAFCYGDSLDSSMANFNGNFPYNAEDGVYRGKTTVVGSFNPNVWGLYDMHGNVCEWCWDWYGEKYNLENPVNNSYDADSGAYRVLRGGSWNYGGDCLRSADRDWSGANESGSNGGFRVAKSL